MTYSFPNMQCTQCQHTQFATTGYRSSAVICKHCGKFFNAPPIPKITDGETVSGNPSEYTPGEGADPDIGVAKDDWVNVQGAEFLMGSPLSEDNRSDDEYQHLVKISEFHILKTPITFKQYALFCIDQGLPLPLEETAELQLLQHTNQPLPKQQDSSRQLVPVNVNFFQALDYSHWLSDKTGWHCRLPTEAEWEYACRAGTTTPYWTGRNITTQQANFSGSFSYGGGYGADSRWQRTPVNYFPANRFGIFDMTGNLDELCDSLYDETYQGAEKQRASEHVDFEKARVPFTKQQTNAKTSTPPLHFSIVCRGGNWHSGYDLRSAKRRKINGCYADDKGSFRLVRTVSA